MLFLKLRIGGHLCALEAAQIVEVLPLVDLTPAPGSSGTDGYFNYHGTAVRVVDLSARATGRPAERRLSTRVIIAREPRTKTLFGLIAERATETFQRDPADFKASNGSGAVEPRSNAQPFALGAAALEGTQLIYRIDIEALGGMAQHVA